MGDLREELIRLAEEYRKRHLGCAISVGSAAMAYQCVERDLRSILARHPAPSPSVSRDAEMRVIEAARRLGRALLGVRLPYENDGWQRLLDLRNALTDLDAALSPRSEAESGRTCDSCRVRAYCLPNATTGEKITGARGACARYVATGAPVPAEPATKGET